MRDRAGRWWKSWKTWVLAWLPVLVREGLDWWQRLAFASERAPKLPWWKSAVIAINGFLQSPWWGAALTLLAMGGSFAILFFLRRENKALLQEAELLKNPPPPEPALEDQYDVALVDRLTSIWRLDGKDPVQTISVLFMDVVFKAKAKNYFVDIFISPKVDDLNRAGENFGASLGSERRARARASDVIDRFNTMYTAYLSAIKWTVTLQTHENANVEDYDQRIEGWERGHKRFFAKLTELVHERREYEKLKIFQRNFAEHSRWDAYYELLARAESRDG